MSVTTCPICHRSFRARSDAVYCSPACRQKAHRVRAAARRDQLTAEAGSVTVSARAREALHRSVAASVQRARDQVELSRELCRGAERRVREADAIRREFGDKRVGERAPWPGS
jgi:hypothetical protein